MIDDTENRALARVGTVLDDKWTLERLLGVGGMAAVYSARHRNGARAAVKVLHPDLSRHKEVRERFRREGYAANRVEHAGAVRVLDDHVVSAGPDAGIVYLVMELLEGESLQDRLERGPPVSEIEFLRIAESVLDVLEAAHERGVIHRDLKPENLFLVHEDAAERALSLPRVKVLDFGLARLLQGQAITTYGLALGTPSFMSPEQAAGRLDEIDGRTDLFALAATGFRLRTGQRIHEAENPVDLVRKMAHLAAPRIRSVASDVSEPYARVIDCALEFRREDRYESAAAMRKDVARAISELSAGVAPTLLAVSPPPVGEPTVELSQGDLESSPDLLEESIHIPKRRSILPWIALLVFCGIGGKLWLDARSTGTVPVAAPVLSTSPSFGPPLATTGIPAALHDSGTEAGTTLTDAAVASLAASADASREADVTSPVKPATPPPSASKNHRPTPTKVGPANVHKLKHGASNPTAQRHSQ